MKKNYLIILLLFCISNGIGQNPVLKILPQIKLPHDSITKTKLINSLQLFLRDKDTQLEKSSVVDSNHFYKYKSFFDEFKDIEKSKKYNDDNFFKCYLKNVVFQPDTTYQIDLSYFGISPENEVVNRLNVSLLAMETPGNFKFYCLFERNIKNWRSAKIGDINFHYQSSLNKTVAADFVNYNNRIAAKLGLKPIQFDFYRCKDIHEVYKIMGIDYDMSINGEVRSGMLDIPNKIFIAGTNTDQYKHDLTHGYFSLKYSDSIRNWTAEEGYNIYNTDYWGETMEHIFDYLKEHIKNNPATSLYEDFKKNIYLKFPIPIKYPLSALLVRKVERELGFEKVLTLISSGENDENYFLLLQKFIGLTKDNFDLIIKNELNR